MKRPWMPLYIADYLKDTTHLGALESGAYLHLIMDYWQNGKLPDDDRRLARISRMTDREWKKARPILQAFFHDGWRHKRIDEELAHATDVSEKRKKAVEIREQKRQQAANNAASNTSSNDDTLHTSQRKKDSDADASGAIAPIDHRKRLFDVGLQTLARLTGKGPDACRSFVGKCLKAAGDDAVTVLGLIEEAERNQVVDPSAWIAARLKPQGNFHGKPETRPGVVEVARRLAEQFEGQSGDRLEGHSGPLLRLPAR